MKIEGNEKCHACPRVLASVLFRYFGIPRLLRGFRLFRWCSAFRCSVFRCSACVPCSGVPGFIVCRFHVNIAKFLRTAFFIKHFRWLLLNKVKTNVKSTWFILLPDWLYYVIKSIMILNSKHSAKLQRYRSRNTKKQKHKKLKHRKTKT